MENDSWVVDNWEDWQDIRLGWCLRCDANEGHTKPIDDTGIYYCNVCDTRYERATVMV